MFKEIIKNIFNKFAYRAVCYAEEQIGGGNGQLKKQIAIDFLITKLPVYLKPFTFLIKNFLNDIADSIIEKAVDMLHSVQKQKKKELNIGD